MPLSGRLLNARGAMSLGTPTCHTPIGCIDAFPNGAPWSTRVSASCSIPFLVRPTTMRGLAVRPSSYKCT